MSAAISSDRLVLTDSSGGTGSFTVENDTGDTTATDLGIAGSVAGNTLTGTVLNELGLTTSLATLNDGNGVLIRDSVADMRVTARDGTVYDIDLGRIDEDITNSTDLDDLNNGEGVRIDSSTETADIKFLARDGTEYEVDLSGVTTVGGLITRVSAETDGAITLSITSGDRFTVTDNTTPSSPSSKLFILGTDANGTDVAEDLGILNEDGVAAGTFEGEIVPSAIDSAAVSTVEELIDRVSEQTSGVITLAISPSGTGLTLTDSSGGGGNLIVASTAANPDAASQLGLKTSAGGVASSTVTGARVLSGLGTSLVDSLNGGDGLGTATEITVTDRAGNSATVTGLDSGYSTLDELIEYINGELSAGGVDVSLALNSAGNGLKATDSSGATASNLIIAGDGATALGLASNVAADSFNGANLQLQYVSSATPLSRLNYGRGVGVGSFTLTDGLGNTATVDIGGSEKSLYDIVQEINNAGGGSLAILARVNDTGDGLVLEEDASRLGGATPFFGIKVTSRTGTTARDLNILGEAEDVSGSIDGSYERTIDLDPSDTLDQVVNAINDADIPVKALTVTTGSGATPFRFYITSQISGAKGDLLIDTGGVDLGLSETSAGRDAKVFVGADSPDDAFLITTDTNTVTGVVDGLTLELLKADDEVVNVTVERDTATIEGAMTRFVTTFNDVVGRIDAYDFFNVDTEERGVLLGNATTSNVRSAMFRQLSAKALNVTGSYQYLSQIGISVTRDGTISFNRERFSEAYADDPESVEALMAAYDVTTTSTQTLEGGVTVEDDQTTYNSLGFGNLFDRLMEQFTDSINGVVTLADDAFADQVELLNDRVSAFDEKLERRRASLEAQFANLERVLADLQSQQQSLASLAGLIGG